MVQEAFLLTSLALCGGKSYTNSKGIMMQFTKGATMLPHIDTTDSDPEFQVQVLRPVNLR